MGSAVMGSSVMGSSVMLHIIIVSALVSMPVFAQADNRCFLSGGGSSETFFVSENATVGSVIGVLEIVGDAGALGDIILRVDGNQSAVIAIEKHSKNLTLIRPLDKEGIDGPSHVTTNLTCERRGNPNEPSLRIPVKIRVTDVNDNAPVFQNVPYSVNISESTAIGSVIVQRVQALDADQAGAYSTVHYSVLPAPNSDFVDLVSSLEGSVVLKKSLDHETFDQLNITIRAQDQGEPALYSDASVIIHVRDADDQNPIFSQSRYWAHLPQPALHGSWLEMRPEKMKAFDQDLGINSSIQYAWNAGGSEYEDFHLDSADGSVTLARDLGDNELVQPLTLVVKAFQVDNWDRYALTTLTVSRSWTFSPTLQYLQRRYDVTVAEDAAFNVTLLALAVNRPTDSKVRFVLENGREQFSVDNTGEMKLTTALDYEVQNFYQLIVWVTDGVSNDTALVKVTVSNVNDCSPLFSEEEYIFVVNQSTLAKGLVVGRVHVSDADVGDVVTLQFKPTPHSRAFGINDEGEIILSDPSELNATVVPLTVIARDNGIPPRQTVVGVRIDFPADALMASSEIYVSTTGSSAAAPVLLIVLGILLGVLSLIISALAVYVYQNKRGMKAQPVMNLMRPKVNSMFQQNNANDTSSTMDQIHFPVTATLRRMPINPLARGPNGPNGLNGNRKIVPIRTPLSPVPPPPPPPPPPLPPSADAGGSSTASAPTPTCWTADNQRKTASKKLSWEDEFNVFF